MHLTVWLPSSSVVVAIDHLETLYTVVARLSTRMAIGGAPGVDQVSWYRKRNLRILYFIMLPTCIGVEMTSG